MKSKSTEASNIIKLEDEMMKKSPIIVLTLQFYSVVELPSLT